MQNYVTFKLLLRKKLRMTRQASLFFNPHSSYPISVLTIVVFFFSFGSLPNIYIVHTQYLYCQLLYFSSILVVYPISLLFIANIYIYCQLLYFSSVLVKVRIATNVSLSFVCRRTKVLLNIWKRFCVTGKHPTPRTKKLFKKSR